MPASAWEHALLPREVLDLEAMTELLLPTPLMTVMRLQHELEFLRFVVNMTTLLIRCGAPLI